MRAARNALELEARERAALIHRLALALDDMQQHAALAVLIGGEDLGLGHGDGRVAIDDLLDDPAHGLQTQGERDDVEQGTDAVVFQGRKGSKKKAVQEAPVAG